MIHKILKSGSVMLVLGAFIGGCQSTGGKYTIDSQASAPTRASTSDTNEYVARLAVYSIPRVCQTVIIYDGIVSDPKHRRKTQGSFFIRSISQNGHPDYKSWYSVRAAINQVDGKFYFNADNPQQMTCGGRNFHNHFVANGIVEWSNPKIIMSAEDVQKIIQPETVEPTASLSMPLEGATRLN